MNPDRPPDLPNFKNSFFLLSGARYCILKKYLPSSAKNTYDTLYFIRSLFLSETVTVIVDFSQTSCFLFFLKNVFILCFAKLIFRAFAYLFFWFLILKSTRSKNKYLLLPENQYFWDFILFWCFNFTPLRSGLNSVSRMF